MLLHFVMPILHNTGTHKKKEKLWHGNTSQVVMVLVGSDDFLGTLS